MAPLNRRTVLVPGHQLAVGDVVLLFDNSWKVTNITVKGEIWLARVIYLDNLETSRHDVIMVPGEDMFDRVDIPKTMLLRVTLAPYPRGSGPPMTNAREVVDVSPIVAITTTPDWIVTNAEVVEE